MGFKDSVILALFGGGFGLLIGSGLATNLVAFPEPYVIVLAIITILGAAIGWYLSGHKLERTH